MEALGSVIREVNSRDARARSWRCCKGLSIRVPESALGCVANASCNVVNGIRASQQQCPCERQPPVAETGERRPPNLLAELCRKRGSRHAGDVCQRRNGPRRCDVAVNGATRDRDVDRRWLQAIPSDFDHHSQTASGALLPRGRLRDGRRRCRCLWHPAESRC